MDFIKTMWKYINTFANTHLATTKAIALGVVGILVIGLVVRLIRKSLEGRVPAHLLIIITKLIRYGGLIVVISTVLTQLGFNITALLGAAGIVGVALGFASQTSVSNIISGMFLIIEHPFKIGDLIEVGSASGFVESIDLLAVRLRTPDGKFMRIPNETLIKSFVTNKTFYKVRRIALTATIDKKQDVAKVMEIAQAVLEQSKAVKQEKPPSVWIDSSSMWTVDIGMWCWADSRRISGSTADIIEELYGAYQKANITVSLRS